MNEESVTNSPDLPPVEAPPIPPPKPPRLKLPIGKKLVFAILACVLTLGGMEVILVLVGVSPKYLQSDPYVGFQPGVPLFVRDGDLWKTNPIKLSFFNQQEFPVQKAPGEFRIFCMGGSTTFGHPYHDSTSFAGWLREFLHAEAPERSWQVINCGGISYASYRVCLLMEEITQYEPDLFIVYDGHNEFLEQRTYGDLQQRNWLLIAANSVLLRTRIGSVASRLLRPAQAGSPKSTLAAEVDTILEHSIGPTEYHRNPTMQQGVLEHFRCSLDRMCQIARNAKARILFIKPASNLRHFTPFKSEHGIVDVNTILKWERQMKAAQAASRERHPEAQKLFVAATEMDPQFAMGHWQAAESLFEAGNVELAKEHFRRAVDEDVCPLRAIRPIEEAVVAAAGRNHVPLIDLPKFLEDSLAQTEAKGIPGDESFLDHVHHTIDGNRQIARLILDQLTNWKLVQRNADQAATEQRISKLILSRLDRKADALALVQVIQVLSWAGKNTEALRLTDRAEQTFPGLSEVVSYRGRVLDKLGREAEAFECHVEAVRRNPQDPMASTRLGHALFARKRVAEACKNFERALQHTAESAPVSFRITQRMTLGKTYLMLKRWDHAIQMFQQVLRLKSDHTEAQQLLHTAVAERTKVQL